MQKQEKRHESRLKKFWRPSKAASSDESTTGADSPTHLKGQKLQQLQLSPIYNKPTCSLPLLQVWPSQDSPRGEADGQSYIFPQTVEEYNDGSEIDVFHHDHLHADSGIDSVQASPSPNMIPLLPGAKPVTIVTSPTQTPNGSPSPPASITSETFEPNQFFGSSNGIAPDKSDPPKRRQSQARRPSTALLHPDHARLLSLPNYYQGTSDQSSTEDLTEYMKSTGSYKNGIDLTQQLCITASSSTNSSLTSIAGYSQRTCDVWSHQDNRELNHRRRSSTMTNRYSLFDALDLECALLRAAARGSVGPYSLSESLHKLTFTQSLAFPALARGLATKQRRTGQKNSNGSARPANTHESSLNTFAKVITAIVLVVVSILVFLIVYKYVRT